MGDAKFKQGLEHLQLGEKAITKTFFKWSPEWELGSSEFSQAASHFKVAKAFEQAKEAYLKVAECQTKLNAHFLAGQAFENAAAMANETKNFEDAADLYEQASICYFAGGNIDRGAAALVNGGKAVAVTNPDRGILLHITACDCFEAEGREQFSTETFAATIALILKNKKYDKIVSVVDKYLAVLLKLDRKKTYFKMILSKIVILLTIQDLVGAQNTLELAKQEDTFIHSDEYTGGVNLLNAYESGQQDAVSKVIEKPLFTYLDTEIAKLARSLPSLMTNTNEASLLT